MATEETKGKMGGILFNMVATVAREMNQSMAFPSWQQADAETRTAYLRVVDQLLATLEADQPVKIKAQPKVAESTTLPPLETTTLPVLDAQTATAGKASSLLDIIFGEDPAHPVTLSQMPPKNDKKEEARARMAKARAARGKKKVAVATA